MYPFNIFHTIGKIYKLQIRSDPNFRISNEFNFYQFTYQTKKLFNPSENGWGKSIMPTRISPDGLTVTNIINTKNYVFAMHAFPANSSKDCRLDNFPGTIIYYFEVKQTTFLP
jgi:hypothetical protein